MVAPLASLPKLPRLQGVAYCSGFRLMAVAVSLALVGGCASVARLASQPPVVTATPSYGAGGGG
jgi:hypothetical protein